jgi:hypothetical protein
MDSWLADLVRTHRLQLKTEWNGRLHLEPPSTALATPDVLLYRMDDTLEQLDALLRSQSAKGWVDWRPAQLSRLHEHCRCGLNPLLAYFVTGGAALDAVLPELGGAGRTALDQAWLLLAQREIESLCAICRRVGAPTLEYAH